MITRENIKEVLNSLSIEDVNNAYESNKDYVLIEVIYTNCCVWFSIESKDYSEEEEQEAHDSGQLFIDWDQFLELAKEVNTTNTAIQELLK